MKRLLLALVFTAAALPETKLPPGEATAIIQRKCLLCHGEEPLMRHKRDREGWQKIVETMDANGAHVTQEEIDALVQYFFANFGLTEEEKRAAARINVNKAAASRLAKVLKLFPDEAEVIVAYRDKNGAFQSIEDLEKVPGLDPKKVEAAKDRLAFQ